MLPLAFVFSIGLGRDEHPGGDRWFSTDKAKHFFMAAFSQSASYSGLRALRLSHEGALTGAPGIAAAVSVGKEVHDKKSGQIFSLKDLTWDAAGMGAATLVVRH